MNPIEIGKGQSFKGLAEYLLHDAGRDASGEYRQTANRVGWSETLNLDAAAPDRAWRLMLATANSANELKAAAGIKKGKAVAKPVYHYAITFSPDDQTTPDTERAAVRSSLAALGLEDHQALAVRHVDTDHAHIHVMVNLIDPASGMSAASPVMQENGRKSSKRSNSRRKLSQWAAQFERDHGLKITQGRLENANKRQQGEDVKAKRKPRNVHEREQREGTDRRRDFLKRQHNDRAAEIQADTATMKLQNAIDWDALKKSYAIEKQAIRARMSPAMKERSAEIKAAYKPKWTGMFRRHEAERRAFERADRTLIGRIWHSAATFRELAQDGQALGGFVAAFSKENRRAIIMCKHDRERDRLGKALQAESREELAQLKRDFDHDFSSARTRFKTKCEDLKNRQSAGWREIREAWRSYNAERAAAFGKANMRGRRIERVRQQGRGRGRTPEF